MMHKPLRTFISGLKSQKSLALKNLAHHVALIGVIVAKMDRIQYHSNALEGGQQQQMAGSQNDKEL